MKNRNQGRSLATAQMTAVPVELSANIECILYKEFVNLIMLRLRALQNQSATVLTGNIASALKEFEEWHAGLQGKFNDGGNPPQVEVGAGTPCPAHVIERFMAWTPSPHSSN